MIVNSPSPKSSHSSPSAKLRAVAAVPSANTSDVVPAGVVACAYTTLCFTKEPATVVNNLMSSSVPGPGVVVLIHTSPADGDVGAE